MRKLNLASRGPLFRVGSEVISQRLNTLNARIRRDALHNFGDR